MSVNISYKYSYDVRAFRYIIEDRVLPRMNSGFEYPKAKLYRERFKKQSCQNDDTVADFYLIFESD